MKKIVLVGKSSSGKTEFASALKRKGFRVAISHTSRPIRPSEVLGTSYHFISREKFIEMLENGEFIEYDEFNNWFYGLNFEEYEKSHILIQTPRGLERLVEKVGRENLVVIYMNASDETRWQRSVDRGDDVTEIARRINTDNVDFEEFIKNKSWDISIEYKIDDKYDFFINLFCKQ